MKRDAYFDNVVAVLAEEFDWDETTRDICRASLGHADYGNGFPPWFEFICDEPVVSNWRLKANRSSGRWALRLCYYGENPERQARADNITLRLVP